LKRLNDGKRSRLESDLEVSSQIVTVAQPKSFAGAFDQEQIDILQKALQRAWDVVSHTDDNPNHEALETLALCLIAEARIGERNFVKLVNRSIVRFREMRAHKIVRKQKAAQDGHIDI
jgi:hypothetical protein